MLKMFYRSMNNDKGFTLIELIVVIAVLGILAAVALPRVTGITSKAKDNASAEQLRMMNDAAQRYIAEGGTISDSATTSAVIDTLKGTDDLDNDGTDDGPWLDPNESFSNLPDGNNISWSNGQFE